MNASPPSLSSGADTMAAPPVEAEGYAGRPLSTLNNDGSRRWMRPRPSRGRFLTARRLVAYALILIFVAIPYLSMNGKPLVLLDIAARKFTLFGRTFLPTDTLLLSLFMVAVFVTVFLLTAVVGRVWCGWGCPQTVYLEFVFRPIERLFEGTPGRAKKGWLQTSGAGAILKYPVYLLLAVFLAHTFLAYFVGVERLAQWVRQSPLEHPAPFLVMVATTALMLFDFGFFREQLCIVACPYGRFQSVMLDRDSLIVSYDPRRGEPRGKRKAAARPKRARSGDGCTGCGDCGESGGCGGEGHDHEQDLGTPRLSLAVLPDAGAAAGPAAPGRTSGDCVDCGLCVVTCPTGIDIRDGLQMECINCTQCIDACDAVMTKLGRPRGLIRYSSQAAIEGQRTRVLRPRVAIYSLVLVVAVSALTLKIATIADADVTVLRGLGRPFTQLETGEVSNPVRIKIVNRTDAAAVYQIEALGEWIRFVGEEQELAVGAGESRTVPGAIVAPAELFARGRYEAALRVSDQGRFAKEIRYGLVGPAIVDSPRPRTPPEGNP